VILRRTASIVVAAVAAVMLATPAHADSVRDRQWHLQFMNVAAAHQISQGAGVVVAVTDTGVDPRSPELRDAVVPGLTNAAGQSGDGRNDTDGHGTSMAALIAGRGKGGDNGALGIAPRSTILPVQVEFGGPMSDPRYLGPGIDWAVEHGAKVISIASGSSEEPAIKAAVERALAADIVVVAAAGNTPDATKIAFPARLPGVLGVGGVDRQGNHATISVTGPEMVLTAPAVDIVSVGLDGRYLTASGTSDAAAIVAGAVALVRARYPGLKGPEVVRRLTYTAQDKGAPGRDPEYGYGVIDLVKALTAEAPPPSAQPSPAPPAGGPRADPADVIAAIGAAVLAIVAIAVLQMIIRGRRRRGR
jgi:type VII secretion-associated serine protease mycosin